MRKTHLQHGEPKLKFCRSCLLAITMLLCTGLLAVTYIHADIWSLVRRAWSQWRQSVSEKGQPVLHTSPGAITVSTGSTLGSTTTLTTWRPLRPFEILYPHKYQFLLDEPEKCKGENPFLVLMVPVEPRNRVARDAIRMTWGNESLLPNVTIRRLFLLGLMDEKVSRGLQEELWAESQEHHDLLLSNFLDSYTNLTIKTMVMLEWLASRCSGATYAAKVDTDVFLNVDFLVHQLLDYGGSDPKKGYITGAVIYGGIVRRDKASKWYMPSEMYHLPTYPPYVSGNVYIFSLDLPEKILAASRHVRPIHLEDVYVGMCLQHLGLLPTNPAQPGLFSLYQLPYDRCLFSSMVSITKISSSELLAHWNHFSQPSAHC